MRNGNGSGDREKETEIERCERVTLQSAEWLIDKTAARQEAIGASRANENVHSSNSLVVFERAAQMLVEANTIQKGKELKNLALTAADWARRKKMGKAAILHCYTYALEAE